MNMKTMQRSSKGPRSKLKRIAGPALITLGVVLVIFALIISTQGSEDIRIEGNPAIEALIPEENSEVLRQAAVGIDLAPGYDAELTINDIPIPPDQINVLRSEEDPLESADTSGSFGSTLNRFVFQPLDGRAVPELLGGRNCVVADYWPLSDPSSRKRIKWCFTAL